MSLSLEPYREPVIPPSLRRRILLRDNYTCHWCGRQFTPEQANIFAIHEDPPYLAGREASRDEAMLFLVCNRCHKKFGKGFPHLGNRLERIQERITRTFRESREASQSRLEKKFLRKGKEWIEEV